MQNVSNAALKDIKDRLELKQDSEGISRKLDEKNIDEMFRSLIYSNILVFSQT